MKRMEEAKQKYYDVRIPEELSGRVMLEVKKAEVNHNRKMARVKRISFVKRGTAAMTAAAVLFMVGVNTNEAFAREMNNIPIIGTLARVFTIRSYETETEDLKISVDIPSVEMISEELTGMEKEVNEDIYMFCEQYADEAEKRAREYRQAYLDTGGTEEEWAEHGIAIKVWYEVKAQTERYLSLAVMGTESWSSAYSEEKYYNFDMEAGKWVTLEDILGNNYAQIANQSILAQIEERSMEDGMEFWTDDWQGVDINTKFYMNQNQNPVAVLDKYEIAPGAAGRLEFEIKRGSAAGISGTADANAGIGKMEAADIPEKGTETWDGYEDNFAVDSETAAAFGKLVKEAVAKKDIEKLADLTVFPVYVGLPGENPVVETREDFTALGAARLFTDGMINSIGNADESNLHPSMAGFILCGEDGEPNIIFGVQDGRLGICGINY